MNARKRIAATLAMLAAALSLTNASAGTANAEIARAGVAVHVDLMLDKVIGIF